MYSLWGCKYNCDFCLVPQIYQHRIFAQSAERVLEEIRFLKERFDVNFIHFHDDDFCDDVGRTETICRGIIGRKLAVRFGMMTRFDHLSKELLDLLEEAGLIMLTLGIESGTQEGLKKIHKGLTISGIREKMELTRNRRMQINGTYMIGFPWETKQSILEAFRFVKTLPLDSWSLNVLIPFKGLKIRETMEKEDLIETDDLSRYSYKEVVVRTRTLSRRGIESLMSWLLVRYYFRPAFFWWILKRMVRYPVMVRSAFEVLIWGVKNRSRLLFNFLRRPKFNPPA